MAPRTSSLRAALRRLWPLAMAAAALISQPHSVSYAAEPPDRAVGEMLAAGEFAPALRLAAGVADRDQRDALLGRIATAQARAGAHDAWPRTLLGVSDDRARQSALSQLSEPPAAGAQGGQEIDFEPLIELITSTIAPTTWDEAGGPGSIKEFASAGVHIDAGGLLRRTQRKEDTGALIRLRLAAASQPVSRQGIDRPTALRKVSLPRLEKCIQIRLAQGLSVTEAMSVLAGLQRIQYVFVYDDDVVVAGPAGGWRADAAGRLVSATTGHPLVHLDDLVVVLRHLHSAPEATFGCSITPRQEALARAKSFLEQSGQKPLKPSRREAWLEQLRAQLGQQDVEIRGIDPRTGVARTIVEADYHMKLVGMGLERGPLGVPSYLSLVSVKKGQAPPPLEVLRWWFALDYNGVLATQDRDAFELQGRGAKVMSENELLTELGTRVHTGASEPLNEQFTQGFNQKFKELSERYPIYAELRNVCDLAVVAALIKSEGLPDRIGWHMSCFGAGGSYRPTYGRAPKSVETVMNHRVIDGRTIVAGISGGVRVDPWSFVTGNAIKVDTYGMLKADRATAKPPQLPPDAWWWD